MSTFTSFLTQRRKEHGLTIRELSKRTGIGVPTLDKYLSGTRKMPLDRAEKLREVLCNSKDEESEFNALYSRSKANQPRTTQELQFASPGAEYRVATIDYQPFAGSNPPGYVDFLTERWLKASVIRMSTVPQPLLKNGFPSFEIDVRIQALENRETDLLFNLISLQRMKTVSWVQLPLKIALNACLYTPTSEGSPNDATNDQRRRDLRDLIVTGRQPEHGPGFLLVTISGEVGHTYLEHTVGLSKVITSDLSSGKLGKECLLPQNSLDPKFLSQTLSGMEVINSVRPIAVVADELTCLKIVRELNGSGTLALPPNSDAAVVHWSERRLLPAYMFGIGMPRQNNWPQLDFVQQSFRTFLALEGENIAERHKKLYYDMVNEARDCLSKTRLYVGGIKHYERSRSLAVPEGSDKSTWNQMRETLIDQMARAFARRALMLSRRSLDGLPYEMDGWRPILNKAREKVSITDGRNRGRIRNLIVLCAKIALGLDPFQTESDIIGLLRRLAPVVQKDDTANPYVFGDQPQTTWETFLDLMELELDMDLEKLRGDGSPERFITSADLGRFITRIQTMLESSRDSRLALLIRLFEPQSDANYFKRLRDDYISDLELEAIRLAVEQELPVDVEPVPANPDATTKLVRFMAYNQSDPVGFMDVLIPAGISVRPFPVAEPVVTTKERPVTLTRIVEADAAIRIRRLYVKRHLHREDVIYRLIRRVVEEANNSRTVQAVWIEDADANASIKNNSLVTFFEDSGFAPTGESKLWYEIKIDQGRPG